MKHIRYATKSLPVSAQDFCTYGPFVPVKEAVGKVPTPGANEELGPPPFGYTWYCK